MKLGPAPLATFASFPVSLRWPARHPERLQLYSLTTPNGVKVSIMLEAIGMPYEAHRVSFDGDQQKTPEFLSINPNGKIPAILDPDGPGGQPLALFESGAILLYLAEKSGQMLPRDAARRHETLQWLMFQMSGIWPVFGQAGFFHKFAGRPFEDKRPRDRYVEDVQPVVAGTRPALGRSPLDHGRRVHHRRHRNNSVDRQSRRLLRRW